MVDRLSGDRSFVGHSSGKVNFSHSQNERLMRKGYTGCPCVVDSEEGYLRIQRDHDLLGQWAEEWQMEFNLDNYELLQFGKANQ
eukprot:g31306.t1